MSYQILVTEHLPDSGLNILKQANDISLFGPVHNRAELLASVRDADAIIVRSKTIVDRELLEAGTKLKIVARAGAQYENIDVEEASRRGVMVMNAPEANVYAIVEYVFGMILALGRKLPLGVQSLRDGKWLRHEIVGFQLYGKTLGVVGYGRLGYEISIRARVFGIHVLVYDPYVDLSEIREPGIEIVGFSELLERSDILTLQTSISPSTIGLMNEEAFAKIKKGAYLINCVHAELVDEAALLKGLDEGSLSGAALDTFAKEPPQPNSPLIHHPKVLASPHLNQNTIESQNETGLQVATHVINALKGEDYINIVNLPFSASVPYKINKAYIHLANRIGKLLGQTAESPISRVEIELLGDELEPLMHVAAANLLDGMCCLPTDPHYNWVSAPILSYEKGLKTAQLKNILDLPEYPNLMICKVVCENGLSQVAAGIIRSNEEANIVHYDGYNVNTIPEGNVLVLENEDIPGVIGKVGTSLGEAKINIVNWSYGREIIGGRAASFISIDGVPPKEVLENLEKEAEIYRAKWVKFD